MGVPNDDRSPLAIALSWASQAMVIAMEMALPGLIGYWLDGKFGTGVVLTLCGVGVGFAIGTWHLVLLTRTMNGNGGQDGWEARESDAAGNDGDTNDHTR